MATSAGALPCIDGGSSLASASKLMREAKVDALLVTVRKGGCLLPAGVITARDIVVRVLAVGLDPSILTADDLLWYD